MQSYNYVARDAAGRRMKGVVKAADEVSARAKLKHMNVYVTSLSHIPSWLLSFYAARVGSAEVLIFSEQLAAMLQAGISIGKALDTLARQTTHATLRRVLMDVREDVHRGQSLADALSLHPQVFNTFYVQLVRVGEMSGQLDSMLLRIVEHVEDEREVQRKIISALAYPGFVLLISALVITILMVFVMPKFQVMYQQLGSDLPLPTKTLIAFSSWFRQVGWLVLLISACGAFVLYRVRENPRIRVRLDAWQLRVPVIGRLLQRVLVTKFLHVFGVLINSGVPLMESLTLIEMTAHNRVLSRLVGKLQFAVSRGQPISESLAKEPLLPPVATQMVAAGEESGDLGGMLLRASSFLRREVDIRLKRMINSLGPALTILLALLVGGIVLSIYLPIFEITSKIGH